MAINEVKLNGETLLTTRGDTVSPETLAQGETATNRAGEKITGRMDGEVSDAYKITDPVGTIADDDYVPFNDVSDSTSPKKKTLFSAFIEKLKGFFLKSKGGKYGLDTNTDTVDFTSTDIDASRGDNNVSSIRYPSVSNILDRMKRIIMRTEAVVNPNGKIGWKSYVKNYDTDGNVVGQKGMQFHMDKSGNLEYQIDDFNAFRAAIQTVDQLGTTIPADSDLNDYMTAGTYRVPDDSTAADIENLPLPLCGKVVVLDNGNGGLEQVYFPNHEPRILVRSYWSSTWGDWKELELKTAGAIYALIDGSNISDPDKFRENIKTIDQMGTEIPANADLNDYTTAGVYQCELTATARTMSNMPYTDNYRIAFKLVVIDGRISNNKIQFYIPYGNDNNSLISYRFTDNNGSTWSAWQSSVKTYADTSDSRPILSMVASVSNNKRGIIHFNKVENHLRHNFHDGTNWGSEKTLANYDDIWSRMLKQANGTNIPANSNLNNYTTNGMYYYSTGDAPSISNVPEQSSGLLYVIESWANNYKRQIVFQRDNANIYTRTYFAGNSTWSSWIRLASTDDISSLDDAIISNNDITTIVTSLDDIPINTAGRITLDASISPTGWQLGFVYMCYGLSRGERIIELTRLNHSNKNSEERWYNATDTVNGWTGWMPLSRQGTYVGTCATAANERAKVANVDADFSLKKGVRIAIKFSNTNTYPNTTDNPITLNVNGTGAKNIWGWSTHSGAGNTGTNTTFYGVANRYTNYYYDGTYWVWDGQSGDNDSDIRPSAYCETAAGTAAKTAVCTNYSLLSNSYLHVLIRYANTSAGALTLNVNGQGAKPIYINGAASSTSNYTLPAGTYLVFYNGTNYYFRTDGIMQSASNMYFVSRNEYLFANANYVSGTSGSYGLNCAPATDKNDMFQLKNRGDLANALFYNYRVNNIWKGDGLMFNKWFPNIAYCTSSTEAATAAKVATTQGGGKVITLFAGLVVCVVHSVNNTASNCTLNVDGTGAKQIYYNQGVYTGSADWICGRQNMAILYIFDGTYWRWFGLSRNDNSTNFLRNDASSTLTASGAPYLNVKSSSIDMKAADNGVSSTQYPAYIVQDKNGLDMSRYETVVETNGQIRTFIQVCNYNTTSGSHFRAGITIYSNKSRDVWYGMNNPHYFARAIGHGYGTCDTAADQQIKVVSMPRFVLTNGAVVHVKFTNTNTFNSQTATPVQLNVNNTGAKNIWYNTTHSGAGNTGTNTRIYGEAGRIFTYMYDGTYWVWLGCGYEADTVDPRVIGIGYGTCNTAAATAAKVVTLSSYTLRTGGYVTVKFDYDVPASATMNINSRGAKNIYYRGVAITAGLIRGGDRATFIYNGSQYDLIGIDRDDVAGELTQTLAANATSVTFTGLPTSGNVIYDVYTSKAGLNYTDMDDSTSGQLKITFEAQSAAVTVYLRYHWIS